MSKTLSFAALLLASMAVLADEPIDRRAAMASGGELDVSNVAGSISITGWDRAEVSLKGSLWEGARELIFEAEGDRTRIEVVLPKRVRNTKGSKLDIRVPYDTDVLATAVSADIDVRRITGDKRLQTVSGDVTGEINGRDVEVRTVSGDIEVTAKGETNNVQIGVVSGDVMLRDVTGNLTIEAVSGDIDVLDADLERVSIEAVSGDLDLDLNLRSGGRFDAHTVSGNVIIRLRETPDLAVFFESFSGDIQSLFGYDSARTSRYAPGRELRLEVGAGNTPLRVETLSGNITLRADRNPDRATVRDLTTRRRQHEDD